MPLKLTLRNGVYYVRGTVRKTPCYETTGTANPELAEAYRAKREAELYEGAIFGSRVAVSFDRAALSYLEDGDARRSDATKALVKRLVDHFGGTRLAAIDQTACDGAVRKILAADAAPASKNRLVITPLSAILNHAARRGWCGFPHLERKTEPRSRSNWLTPRQALALMNAAAPHLRPLLHFMFACGPRLSEALDLQWSDLHLAESQALFRDTKSGEDRTAHLPSALVARLANMTNKGGPVFRRDDGEPYAEKVTQGGGQIKTAWRGACIRSGLATPVLDAKGAPRTDARGKPVMRPLFTPHDARHSWASWFYGLTKDAVLLKSEGCWESLKMVEKYAHPIPAAVLADVPLVWGDYHPAIGSIRANSVHADTNDSKIA